MVTKSYSLARSLASCHRTYECERTPASREGIKSPPEGRRREVRGREGGREGGRDGRGRGRASVPTTRQPNVRGTRSAYVSIRRVRVHGSCKRNQMCMQILTFLLLPRLCASTYFMVCFIPQVFPPKRTYMKMVAAMSHAHVNPFSLLLLMSVLSSPEYIHTVVGLLNPRMIRKYRVQT